MYFRRYILSYWKCRHIFSFYDQGITYHSSLFRLNNLTYTKVDQNTSIQQLKFSSSYLVSTYVNIQQFDCCTMSTHVNAAHESGFWYITGVVLNLLKQNLRFVTTNFSKLAFTNCCQHHGDCYCEHGVFCRSQLNQWTTEAPEV